MKEINNCIEVKEISFRNGKVICINLQTYVNKNTWFEGLFIKKIFSHIFRSFTSES